ALEVSVKRATGEEVVSEGVAVGGLLDAYLTERKLASKSEAEVRACYRRFAAIAGGGRTSEGHHQGRLSRLQGIPPGRSFQSGAVQGRQAVTQVHQEAPGYRVDHLALWRVARARRQQPLRGDHSGCQRGSCECGASATL